MRRLLHGLLLAWLICFSCQLLAQDTIPPVITCPGNITVTLSPGLCEATINFAVSATDNGPTPVISQIDGTGLTSGDDFPSGVYNLIFVATDTSGNKDTCDFDVIINEYVPSSPGLACQSLVHISMPATCEMYLEPYMVLLGNYGCYNDFDVNVNNTGSNYIDYSLVGTTVTYLITNTVTGMMCWGKALIEDKNGPLITGCDSVTLNCLQDIRPVSQGGVVPDPVVSDCNAYTLVYVDMQMQGTCSDTFSVQIMRMWTATDALGYTSTCNQIITVRRLSLAGVTPVCPADATIECSAGVAANLSPAITGYPTVVIDGTTYNLTDGANSICNISASYTDQVIPKCGVSYRVIRTWTVIDWCLPIDMVDNPWTCKQVIFYNDSTGPAIIPPANMTSSANQPGCRARPVIPAAQLTDCSGYTVIMTTPVGPINGNGGQVPAPGLPIGLHTVTVKATDQCGNSSSATFTINVVDNVKPTPVCDAHTVTALDDTGYAFVNATSLDDGSTDNCCISGFSAARMTDNCNNPANLTFRPFVEFCCADVPQPVNVILRVFDCHGNFNECMVQVEVQDKTLPTITCPPDITVNCGFDYNDLSLTGTVVTNPALQGPNDGIAVDNCASALTIIWAQEGPVTCGAGLVFRTFKAMDGAGQMQFCVQRITVANSSPYNGAGIIFPGNTSVNGCNASTAPAVTGQPVLPPPSECYTLVYTHADEVFTTVAGACRKILRRWTVLDWCQYDPNVPNSPGRFEYVQEIMIFDTDAPVSPSCVNRTFCNFKANCEDLVPNLAISATDACTPSAQLTYAWVVDQFNDGVADSGSKFNGTGQNITNAYPVGTHKITYSIFDGCGNTGFCTFLFSIADCKKPTVFCKTGVIVEMMAGGAVDVNVLQLEEGSSFDNCTKRSDLKFSFSPFVNDTVRTFTCADIGSNPVEVWATDLTNNQDFCVTQVIIQDNMGACTSPLIALGGMVATEESKGVQNVMVELDGSTSTMTHTNNTGAFQFANLSTGSNYALAPQLKSNPLNGVTTYDIVLLQRHILGLQPLDTPYKIIAGDINNNGVLTVSDVVDLRKVVLYILPEFPNNTSWRFVDKAYSFPNAQDPFNPPFPEDCSVSNLSPNSPQPDFVAVKVGDLNGTAVTSNLGGSSDDRGAGATFIITTEDREVKAGETVTIDFSANMEGVVGYQFTLNFDAGALDFENLVPGVHADESNFGTTLISNGAITASWSQLAASRTDSPETLFSLTFKVKASGKLSGLMSVNSRFTKAESYGNDGSLHPVSLEYQRQEAGAGNGFELFQNVPNPFAETTVISFQLPEASPASLTIYDVSGRVVKEIKGEFSKGYHEINIGKGSLPDRGIFYYRLETPSNTATRKMIVI